MRLFALGILLVIGSVIFCGCHKARAPTSVECRQLLVSHSTTRAEMVEFIERAKPVLDAAPRDRIDPETEGLGLCTGALMRKSQSAN